VGDVPGGVGVEDPTVGGLGDAFELAGEPAFEAGEVLVAVG
jgi:hypothetical protein